MGKAVEDWAAARLNQMAAALEPLPIQVAALSAMVEHVHQLALSMGPVPAQIAVLAASVERLEAENRALREELAATQRQLVQIAWGLVAALIGAAAALSPRSSDPARGRDQGLRNSTSLSVSGGPALWRGTFTPAATSWRPSSRASARTMER
jgi:outer membrane murein-binding lipoprotein Lpp